MKKRSLIILIVLLAIGFATVSTTLVLNGVIGLGESDDFKIIFKSAVIDGKKRNDIISGDKTSITYETNVLSTINDNSILDYEVTNTSKNYDANVSIACNIVDETGSKIEEANIYVDMTYEPNSMMISSGETKKGKITARLIKAVTEDTNINIKCTLNASAEIRDSLGEGYEIPFSRASTIMVRDENSFWKHDYKITRLVLEDKMIPHETEDELIFDVSEAQDGSVMAYLVRNEDDDTRFTAYLQGDTGIKANSNSSNLFSGFSKITEIEGLEYLDTSNVTDMSSMFIGDSYIRTLNLTNFDTRNVTNMSSMFSYCQKLTALDLSSFDTGNVTSMSDMFEQCSSLTEWDFDNFETSSVIDMSGMFKGCSSLITLSLSFDTSSVTSMGSLFEGCSSLTSLDVSNFNTSSVMDMSYMFKTCSRLATLNVSNFDTSNVTTMRGLFEGCSSLKVLELNNFDTSSVTYMDNMFSSCKRLTELDLSNFETSSVTDMADMFSYCEKLVNIELNNFDTSNVKYMYNMFYECSSLTVLDLSNFNTSSLTDMSGMFKECSSLTTLDLSSFDISKITRADYLFSFVTTNPTIFVKDKTVQDWIIKYGEESFSTSNVIIKG